MQKNNNNAYILIWAIFLSLIISVSFIQISTKINKNLKNNQNIIKELKIDSEIINILNNGIINKDYTNKTLDNGDKIVYDKTDESIFSLKKEDSNISKINTPSNITITILNGGPITYKNNTESGIINNFKTIAATNGDFIINNLGGFTKIKIQSDQNNNYLKQYLNYKIIKKIGNKEIIEKKGKIKSF